ncbi:hypothetical protein [Desulfopila aestuarii]|uniref:Uncharacterized protein n=1 Tax=Desulfopila aestuarii DSM 18488 TaxID=1121416 RepID=A0A1M7YEH0_9BACT|nr:hypothetical protein [Desulfopila aestuarii]SHO51042.1 hypothetical protein SAMN02745220_03789 [Desulfopila aestuarii DSM 18488]
MKGDFGSMVWVNDKEGHEYVCTVDRKHDKAKDISDLSEEEKKTCMDVNILVGTERW